MLRKGFVPLLSVILPLAITAAVAAGEPLPQSSGSKASASKTLNQPTISDMRARGLLTIIEDDLGPSVQIFELCDSVKGYGDYQANESHQFSRGKKAYVYSQIGDLQCDRTPKGKYRLSLAVDARITDSAGKEIWQKDSVFTFDQELDFEANEIWAYFWTPILFFIKKGDYLIELTILDRLASEISYVYTLLNVK